MGGSKQGLTVVRADVQSVKGGEVLAVPSSSDLVLYGLFLAMAPKIRDSVLC